MKRGSWGPGVQPRPQDTIETDFTPGVSYPIRPPEVTLRRSVPEFEAADDGWNCLLIRGYRVSWRQIRYGLSATNTCDKEQRWLRDASSSMH